MIDLRKLAADNELFDGHYKLLKPLSTVGGTADVWLAVDKNMLDNELSDDKTANSEEDATVAIKIYRPKNALDIEGEQRFRDEYRIVFNCNHTNLIHPAYFSIYKEIPYLVLPYCRKGSSERLIGKLKNEEDIWKYILDVASGLDYLHACDPPIVHQDIKPANVLIDDKGNYAITDFGISAKSGNKHQYYYDDENSGTLAYMSPERFVAGYEPIASSDIWAFGVTLYEILTGKVPFGERGGQSQQEGKVSIEFPSFVPKEVKKMIIACLDLNPAKRPTAKQLMRTAESRKFSAKRRLSWLLIILPIAVIVAAISGFIIFKSGRNTVVAQPVVPIEETFSYASQLMDLNSKDSLEKGMVIMDSLCTKNYVPALYEMFLTYGNSNNSLGLQRKKILGIDYVKPEDNPATAYYPVDNRYNEKAVEYLRKIVNQEDDTHYKIKSYAAYYLSMYYLNGGFLAIDKELSDELCNKAEKWAELGGEIDLADRIRKMKIQ